MIEYTHHGNQDENHEEEAAPHIFINAQGGVPLHIEAESILCTVHFGVDEHDEGAAERIDKAGNDGRTCCRKHDFEETFEPFQFERVRIVQIAFVNGLNPGDCRKERCPDTAVNDDDDTRPPHCRREENDEGGEEDGRHATETVDNRVQNLSCFLVEAHQETDTERENQGNQHGRHKKQKRGDYILKLHPAIVVESLRDESHFREHQGADPTVIRDHDVAENHGKEDQISNPVIFQVLYYFFHDCLSSDAWDRGGAVDTFFSCFPLCSLKSVYSTRLATSLLMVRTSSARRFKISGSSNMVSRLPLFSSGILSS